MENQNQAQQSLRDLGADNLKVILTLLVVLGHMASPFSALIYSFHMPMFFFLSGMFICSQKRTMKKDFSRLLAPFFVFSIVGLFCELLKRLLLGRELEILTLLNDAYIFITSEAYYYGFVLWFLPALFWGKNLTKLCLNKYGPFSALLIIVCSFIFFENLSYLPFALGQAFVAFIFIYFGSLFARFREYVHYLVPVSLVFFLFCFSEIKPFDIGALAIPMSALSLIGVLSLCVLIVFIFDQFFNRFKFMGLAGMVGYCMLFFIIHPYTNNLALLFIQRVDFLNFWFYQFIFSFFLLCLAAAFKRLFHNFWLFKYV